VCSTTRARIGCIQFPSIFSMNAESDNRRNGNSPSFDDAAFFSGVALETASTSVSSLAQSHLRFDTSTSARDNARTPRPGKKSATHFYPCSRRASRAFLSTYTLSGPIKRTRRRQCNHAGDRHRILLCEHPLRAPMGARAGLWLSEPTDRRGLWCSEIMCFVERHLAGS
jgi:hypothetical protein